MFDKITKNNQIKTAVFLHGLNQKEPQMKKEFIQHYENKLRIKQHILLRAFIINLALIFIVWMLSLSVEFVELVAFVTSVPVALAYVNMLNWLAYWDIAGVVLFLVPAIAMWWQRCCLKKEI